MLWGSALFPESHSICTKLQLWNISFDSKQPGSKEKTPKCFWNYNLGLPMILLLDMEHRESLCQKNWKMVPMLKTLSQEPYFPETHEWVHFKIFSGCTISLLTGKQVCFWICPFPTPHITYRETENNEDFREDGPAEACAGAGAELGRQAYEAQLSTSFYKNDTLDQGHDTWAFTLQTLFPMVTSIV